MDKYYKMINILVSNVSIRDEIFNKLNEIDKNPNIYIEENDRMVTIDDDYLWLACVDLLIDSGYAFEIDWKEYYDVAQDLTQELMNNIKLNFHFQEQIVDDLEAEVFLPLMSHEIKENTEYQMVNLDIDSDSYVSTLVNKNHLKELKSLDDRIKIY